MTEKLAVEEVEEPKGLDKSDLDGNIFASTVCSPGTHRDYHCYERQKVFRVDAQHRCGNKVRDFDAPGCPFSSSDIVPAMHPCSNKEPRRIQDRGNVRNTARLPAKLSANHVPPSVSTIGQVANELARCSPSVTRVSAVCDILATESSAASSCALTSSSRVMVPVS